MERFIDGYGWNYPNAALSLVDADENMDTVILAITLPRYDNHTGTLIYTAKILEDLVNDRFIYHISRADVGIPEEFGRAALFIDDCGYGFWICGTKKTKKWCTHCGKLKCNCCGHVGQFYCKPCKSDSYYKTECREKWGGVCGDFKCDDTCDF